MRVYGKRYGKNRKKRNPDEPIKYVSPARRRDPWSTVTIRSAHYAMIRELGEVWKVTVGQVVMNLVEKEFKKLLWEQEHAERMKAGTYVPKA